MDWRFADEPQRQLTEQTVARLAAYVAERRALVRPFFKSLDPHNNGHLPRARFRQACRRAATHFRHLTNTRFRFLISILLGGSVAERLACWTQAQDGLGLNRSRALSGNSIK